MKRKHTIHKHKHKQHYHHHRQKKRLPRARRMTQKIKTRHYRKRIPKKNLKSTGGAMKLFPSGACCKTK